MNYSSSLLVKCVATLHFCCVVSVLHDGYYSKSPRPNRRLLSCFYVRFSSPQFVTIISGIVHHGAEWVDVFVTVENLK